MKQAIGCIVLSLVGMTGCAASGAKGDAAAAPVRVGCDPAGNPTREGLAEAMGPVHKQVKYCYEKELGRESDFSGSMSVKILFGTDGVVSTAEVADATFHSPDMENCILVAIKAVRVTPCVRGKSMSILYPIELKPVFQ